MTEAADSDDQRATRPTCSLFTKQANTDGCWQSQETSTYLTPRGDGARSRGGLAPAPCRVKAERGHEQALGPAVKPGIDKGITTGEAPDTKRTKAPS